MTDNIHPLPPPLESKYKGGNGGGNGGDLRDRVSKLEAHLHHLATKEDVANLKVWVLYGLVAGIVIAVSLAAAIIRLFL